MFVALAVKIFPYASVPLILTVTTGVPLVTVVPPVPVASEPTLLYPLALVYVVVSATVTVHPIYLPIYVTLSRANVLVLVAEPIFVPLDAVLLSVHHH